MMHKELQVLLHRHENTELCKVMLIDTITNRLIRDECRDTACCPLVLMYHGTTSGGRYTDEQVFHQLLSIQITDGFTAGLWMEYSLHQGSTQIRAAAGTKSIINF